MLGKVRRKGNPPTLLVGMYIGAPSFENNMEVSFKKKRRIAIKSKQSYICICMCACLVSSVMSDSLRPYGPRPARLLCPWDSPGKNNGVGCHFLLQLLYISLSIYLSIYIKDENSHSKKKIHAPLYS